MRGEAEPQAEGELSLFIADILSLQSDHIVCILYKGDRQKLTQGIRGLSERLYRVLSCVQKGRAFRI